MVKNAPGNPLAIDMTLRRGGRPVAATTEDLAAGAGHQWPHRLGRLVFLGTPHHGSPLERAGHGIDRALAGLIRALPGRAGR